MNRRITTRGIIYKDGKLFALRQRRQDGSVNKYWCTMGGGVDSAEPLLEATRREILEEVGIEPVIGDLLYVQQFIGEYNGEKMEFIELFYNITNTDEFHEIDLAKTSHGVEEIEEFAFIDPKLANILPKFLTETDIAADIATGKTQFFSYL